MKLFRLIRQNLVSEGKTGKYLKYAIGEIVLVVIGILIALSLNNWNTKRKERVLEIKTLSELSASFAGDLRDINYNLTLHNSGLLASQQLLKAFDEDLPYNDSLDSHFGQFYNLSVFLHSTGAFETLKSRGMDIISNDSLRRHVVKMYDIIYNEIIENQRNFDYPDLQENKHFMFEHMTDWKFFQSAKPRDYEMISKDPVFRNRLEYTVQVRSIMISRYQTAKTECERIIHSLDKEIERLEE